MVQQLLFSKMIHAAYLVVVEAVDQFPCRLSIGCCFRNNILYSFRKVNALVANIWPIALILYFVNTQGADYFLWSNKVKQTLLSKTTSRKTLLGKHGKVGERL